MKSCFWPSQNWLEIGMKVYFYEKNWKPKNFKATFSIWVILISRKMWRKNTYFVIQIHKFVVVMCTKMRKYLKKKSFNLWRFASIFFEYVRISFLLNCTTQQMPSQWILFLNMKVSGFYIRLLEKSTKNRLVGRLEYSLYKYLYEIKPFHYPPHYHIFFGTYQRFYEWSLCRIEFPVKQAIRDEYLCLKVIVEKVYVLG